LHRVVLSSISVASLFHKPRATIACPDSRATHEPVEPGTL
jgi:hypothetical protein